MSSSMLGTGSFATTNYKSVAGCNWINNVDQKSKLTTTANVVDPAGGNTQVVWPTGRNNGNADGVDNGNGIICRGGGTTAVAAPVVTVAADIRDGISKTLAVGESIPLFCGWCSGPGLKGDRHLRAPDKLEYE